MVLAGPGTGKTQLLAARIGNILLQTDVQASNILCLTFSDAGVKAMRRRLLDFIGPEAHRVGIYTFHSFCNRIIQENLHLFGSRNLQSLTDLERVNLIRGLLDKLPPDNPLVVSRWDRYYYLPHLEHLFQTMKTEHWSVELVRRSISGYLDSLPERKDFQYQRAYKQFRKGDPKAGEMEKEQKKMVPLAAAAELFPAYEKALRTEARYDYEDMLLWVLEAFREHEWLLRSYQERFQYLLVDEYQDTNGAQNELLLQLASFWEDNPNLFVVGDDDQSIYEFQGARLQNMLDLLDRYRPHMHLVSLRQNYRSIPAILSSASGLIGRNEQRLVHHLEAGPKELAAAHPDRMHQTNRPVLLEYPHIRQEEVGLVLQIEELIRSGESPESIAIMYARHKQAHRIMELFSKKGIRFTTRRPVDLLNEPQIQHLIYLGRYLNRELKLAFSGEADLFPFLHAAFLQLDPVDLAHLSAYRAGRPGNSRPEWRRMLTDPDLLRRRKLNRPDRLLEVGERLTSWIRHAANLSVPHLLERLINESGFLAYTLSLPDKDEWLQALATLMRFTRQEAERHTHYTLAQWVNTLDQMAANRIPLPLQRIAEKGEGIQMLTAHSSKGLEFRYVFLLDATQNPWDSGRNGQRQFSFPDTLTFSGLTDALEARRRLFYVAMTRAETHLQISWSLEDAKGKETQPSQFVDELLEQEGLAKTRASVSAADLLDAEWISLFREEEPVRAESPPPAVLEDLLDGFRFSPSSLNRFLQCPLAFYYEHLLKVPVPFSNAALMGTAVHQALERLFGKKERTQKDLLKYFREEMERIRGLMDASGWEQRLDRGLYFLPIYFQQKAPGWPSFSLTEFRVRESEVDGVPVTGIVDRIDLIDGNKAVLLDYKTGRYRKERAREPDDRNPQGGPYWRQLQFYNLLLQQNPVLKGRRLDYGLISFVEPDPDGQVHEHRVAYDKEGEVLIRNLLQESWRQVKDHKFLEGCGKTDCSWCNFTRHNMQVSSFADEEQEGLDDES